MCVWEGGGHCVCERALLKGVSPCYRGRPAWVCRLPVCKGALGGARTCASAQGGWYARAYKLRAYLCSEKWNTIQGRCHVVAAGDVRRGDNQKRSISLPMRARDPRGPAAHDRRGPGHASASAPGRVRQRRLTRGQKVGLRGGLRGHSTVRPAPFGRGAGRSGPGSRACAAGAAAPGPLVGLGQGWRALGGCGGRVSGRLATGVCQAHARSDGAGSY